LKIRLLGAQFFDAERHTDRHDEANSRFSLFCEGTEKLALNSHHKFRNRNHCLSNSCLWTFTLAILVFLRMNNQIRKKIFLFTTIEQPSTKFWVCTNATDECIVSVLIEVLSWTGRNCRWGLSFVALYAEKMKGKRSR